MQDQTLLAVHGVQVSADRIRSFQFGKEHGGSQILFINYKK